MLTVAPGGNNLATICYKDFLGLATINMYYYYYYYYYSLARLGCVYLLHHLLLTFATLSVEEVYFVVFPGYIPLSGVGTPRELFL